MKKILFVLLAACMALISKGQTRHPYYGGVIISIVMADTIREEAGLITVGAIIKIAGLGIRMGGIKGAEFLYRILFPLFGYRRTE